MAGDEAQTDPKCAPEQAGIILDRLGLELERAELNNPPAIPGLQDDASQLLAYLDDWLASEAPELSALAQDAAASSSPGALARSLRVLAEALLELADRQEASVPDFDPHSVAGALRVLESELGAELHGEDAERALLALRVELAKVAGDAREWAERRGLSTEAVPQMPSANASRQDCMLALRDLAAALQELALQGPEPSNDSS